MSPTSQSTGSGSAASQGAASQPPALTEADLAARLEQSIQPGEPVRLVAIHGLWSGPGEVKTERGTFEVHQAQSELHLRSLLPPMDEARAMVFAVPWTQRLPLDLAGRFVRGGKVIAVGTDHRLQRMFKVRDVSEAMRRNERLARHLTLYADRTFASPGTQLRPQTLWDTWLQKIVGAPSHESTAPLAALFAWALAGSGERELAARVDESPGLRPAVLAELTRRYGEGADVVWKAWEQGSADALLEACVWMEILRADAKTGVAQSFWMRRIEPAWGLAPDDAASVALAGCLDAVGAHPDAPSRALERACRSAERVIVEVERSPDLDAALAKSPRLERGLDGALETTGRALSRFAKGPTAERWETLRSAFETLATHRLAETRKGRITQARMTLRLAAFLLERPDRHVPTDDSPRAELKRLARWYVAEGGYLDRARTRARHATGDGAFGKGVLAVLGAVDAIRAEMDRAYAAELAEWYADGRLGTPLLPIEAATKTFVADFLAEQSERRALIVLLDGMAWAQAVELLEALEAQSNEAGWGVLAWSGQLASSKHQADFVPVQAALPTVTEVSRASFFAGKAFGLKDKQNTTDDIKRFAGNAALRKLSEQEPRLFLQGSLGVGGVISAEMRHAIDDAGQRVVGVVLNAIDDFLKAGIGQATEWNLETIHALPHLLEAARKARRVVLFASDHGHVPGALLDYEKAGSGAARWRTGEAGGALAEHEVRFDKAHAWGPPGADSIVLLADELHRYNKQRHAGEHGGATLAETLCPTFLLGYRGLSTELDDANLRVLDARPPAWWELSPATLVVRRMAVRLAPEPPAQPASEPAAWDTRSDHAPTPKTPPEALAPAKPDRAPPPPIEDHPLMASTLFAAHSDKRRRQALAAVDFLFSRNGRANGKAFASAMKKRHATLNGFIANLQTVLNEDQASVLRYEVEADQVVLDVPMLESVFEVKL